MAMATSCSRRLPFTPPHRIDEQLPWARVPTPVTPHKPIAKLGRAEANNTRPPGRECESTCKQIPPDLPICPFDSDALLCWAAHSQNSGMVTSSKPSRPALLDGMSTYRGCLVRKCWPPAEVGGRGWEPQQGDPKTRQSGDVVAPSPARLPHGSRPMLLLDTNSESVCCVPST